MVFFKFLVNDLPCYPEIMISKCKNSFQLKITVVDNFLFLWKTFWCCDGYRGIKPD